jgi:hypothetical protein
VLGNYDGDKLLSRIQIFWHDLLNVRRRWLQDLPGHGGGPMCHNWDGVDGRSFCKQNHSVSELQKEWVRFCDRYFDKIIRRY